MYVYMNIYIRVLFHNSIYILNFCYNKEIWFEWQLTKLYIVETGTVKRLVNFAKLQNVMGL